MRSGRFVFAGVSLILGLVFGCANEPKRAETVVSPAHDELPETQRAMRNIPAKVSVENVERVPREPLVVLPDISKPTPEERAKLGPEAAPKKDRTAFAFYRKERGPEQGVAPFADPPRSDIGTPDRTRFGITSTRMGSSPDAFSDGGARTQISDFPEIKSAEATYNPNRFGITLFPYYPSTGMIGWRRGAAVDPVIPYRD